MHLTTSSEEDIISFNKKRGIQEENGHNEVEETGLWERWRRLRYNYKAYYYHFISINLFIHLTPRPSASTAYIRSPTNINLFDN